MGCFYKCVVNEIQLQIQKSEQGHFNKIYGHGLMNKPFALLELVACVAGTAFDQDVCIATTL